MVCVQLSHSVKPMVVKALLVGPGPVGVSGPWSRYSLLSLGMPLPLGRSTCARESRVGGTIGHVKIMCFEVHN